MLYRKIYSFVIKVAVVCVAIAVLSSCLNKKVIVPYPKPEALRVDITNLLENEKTLKDRYDEFSGLLAQVRRIRNDITQIGIPVSCVDSQIKKIEDECDSIEIINERHLKGENYKTAYLKLKEEVLIDSNYIKWFKDSVENNLTSVFQGYIYQKRKSPHMQKVLQFTKDDLPTPLSALRAVHVTTSLTDSKNKSIFNILYYYQKTRYGTKYPMGEDNIIITYKNNSILISYDENHKNVHRINLNELANFIKDIDFEPISHKNVYIEAFESYLIKSRQEIIKLKSSVNSLKNAASMLNVKNDKITCTLLRIGTSFWDKLDSSLQKVYLKEYKGNRYISFSVNYLKRMNNINIKLNDHYKVARHLFDNIIRKAIRKLHPLLKNKKIYGLAISIVGVDQNFVNKENTNLSVYEFNIPNRKISQYINDDITGQELANHSFILVDGERIALR